MTDTEESRPGSPNWSSDPRLAERRPQPDQRYTVTVTSCDGHEYSFAGLSFEDARSRVTAQLGLIALGDCHTVCGVTLTPDTFPAGHEHP